MARIYVRTPPVERFLAKVEVDPATGCWLWTASLGGAGYGRFPRGGRAAGSEPAHRWAYTHWVGAIGAGLTIDHVCHNRDASCPGGPTCPHRACVNPDHLEAVTIGVNVLRSPRSIAAAHAAKTHCPYGHRYDRVRPNGKRVCTTCHLAENRRRRAREKDAELARIWWPDLLEPRAGRRGLG